MSYELRSNLSRIGVILSNYSIVGLVLSGLFFSVSFAVPLFVTFALLLYFMFFLFLIVCTIGLVFFVEPLTSVFGTLGGFLSGTGESLQFLVPIAGWVLLASLVLSVVSTVLLFFEPSRKKHGWRIAVTFIILAIAIVVVAGIIVTALS